MNGTRRHAGALHVHRSNRVERLVEALGALVATPRGSVLDPELVVVAGHGMAVWLASELAARLGVWAGPLLYPRELMDRIARCALPATHRTRRLTEALLRWAVHARLPSMLSQAEFGRLATYLGDDTRGIRLAQVATRLARVFDRYLTYRPDWVLAWERGDDSQIPASDRWQAALWRSIAEQLAGWHLAHLEPELVRHLSGSEALAELPPRVSVFGVASLPPLYLRVLVALSLRVDVHLFTFSTSPLGQGPSSDSDVQPVSSLGAHLAVSEDFEAALEAALVGLGVAPERHDVFEVPPSGSLLGAVQRELYRQPTSAPRVDTSSIELDIEVHACHAPMREVEVLHDQLLALLTRSSDPVRPHEVLVLSPQLDLYAPLVRAVFARDGSDDRFVPFHISDRGARARLPLLEALLRVFDMVRGRITAADILDLLALDPIQTRLDLDANSVGTLKQAIVASGIRWGVDAAHRAQHGLPRDDANTWRFGLRRLLLGVAMEGNGDELFRGVHPCAFAAGREALVLGKLARFTRLLFEWLLDAERPRPLVEWANAVTRLLGDLFGEDTESARQAALVERTLAYVAETAGDAGFSGNLDVAVLRTLLEHELDGRAPEQGFLSGGVTFAGMVPMRSIPVRVVALLGMNDRTLPRAPHPMELDLIHLPRRLGDRSPPDDDWYLFLELLCSARDRLIMTYTGFGAQDGRRRPPSACVSELLDTIELRLGVPRSAVVVEHRLHGFNPSYFTRGASHEPGMQPFSYSRESSVVASSLSQVHSQVSFLSQPLAAPRVEAVEVTELVRFFRSPPAHFLNTRLRVTIRQEDAETPVREPLELDALANWSLGQRLVDKLLEETAPEEIERVLRATGQLPLGSWGTVCLESLWPVCAALARQTRALRSGAQLPAVEVRVHLPSGVVVTGSIPSVWPGGVVEHSYSQSKPRKQLATWIRHVSACAAGTAVPSYFVGRKPGDGEVQVSAFQPLATGAATQVLADLVGLYLEGQTTPLPFVPNTSGAYCSRLNRGVEVALKAAITAYEGDFGDSTYDPHLALALDNSMPPFDAACDRAERRCEDSAFHSIAVRVFGPLFQALRVE